MALNLLNLSILFVLLNIINPFPFAEPRTLEASTTPFSKTLQNLRGVHRGQNAKGVGELRGYLQKYGYLTKGSSSNDNFDENVESALKHYQAFHHLRDTGVVDDETIKRMSLPRCGMPDIITNPNPNPNGLVGAPENYTFFPGSPKWSKFFLTYRRTSGATVSINETAVRRAMRDAFQSWANVSPFTFNETTDRSADITYGFHRGLHLDLYPFDGPGRVLAHAFAPEDGRIHFDADELWRSNGSDIDFQTVGLHELGHSLGLGHSNDTDAVMQPNYDGQRRSLSQDDIDGIQALYGQN